MVCENCGTHQETLTSAMLAIETQKTYSPTTNTCDKSVHGLNFAASMSAYLFNQFFRLFSLDAIIELALIDLA